MSLSDVTGLSSVLSGLPRRAASGLRAGGGTFSSVKCEESFQFAPSGGGSSSPDRGLRALDQAASEKRMVVGDHNNLTSGGDNPSIKTEHACAAPRLRIVHHADAKTRFDATAGAVAFYGTTPISNNMIAGLNIRQFAHAGRLHAGC